MTAQESRKAARTYQFGDVKATVTYQTGLAWRYTVHLSVPGRTWKYWDVKVYKEMPDEHLEALEHATRYAIDSLKERNEPGSEKRFDEPFSGTESQRKTWLASLTKGHSQMTQPKAKTLIFRSPRNKPPSGHVPKEIAAGIASTDGKGNWSAAKKTVHFILEVPYAFSADGKRLYGSMNAYFLPEEWNTEKDGLIYTDKTFLKGVQDALRRKGFKHAGDLHYSEQGMQGGVGFNRSRGGGNFVNFDVGSDLARELVDKGYAAVEKE